jgi:hypothetical protein
MGGMKAPLLRRFLLVIPLMVVTGLGCACEEEGPLTDADFFDLMSNVEYYYEMLYQPQPGWWTAGDWRTYYRERLNEQMEYLSAYPAHIRRHHKHFDYLKQLKKQANDIAVNTE